MDNNCICDIGMVDERKGKAVEEIVKILNGFPTRTADDILQEVQNICHFNSVVSVKEE